MVLVLVILPWTALLLWVWPKRELPLITLDYLDGILRSHKLGSQLQNPSLLNGPVTRDLRSATDVHPVAYEQIILKVIFVIQVIQYSFLK